MPKHPVSPKRVLQRLGLEAVIQEAAIQEAAIYIRKINYYKFFVDACNNDPSSHLRSTKNITIIQKNDKNYYYYA